MHRSKLALSLLAMLALALFASRSHAATLTTLLSFNGTNGAYPQGSLTLSGSTLYGPGGGGASNDGFIFSLPVTGGTLTNLGSFNAATGQYPSGSLTLAGSTLYGMTRNDTGTIFSIPVTGGTVTNMFTFNFANGGGSAPSGNLTLDGSTLYGTTYYGGPYSSDGINTDGTIFSIPLAGGTATTLGSFNSANGEHPAGSLTLNSDGSTLYGTTYEGGANGYGAIFSIPVTGGTPTLLASFNGANGAYPEGDLTLIGSTLYGMTVAGGTDRDGTIFSVPVTGGNPNVLASFNGADGAYPEGSLTLAGSTMYGMTSGGFVNDGNIFSISVTGGTITNLVSFDGANGATPDGNLTLSPDGSTLYGMTNAGGADGEGTIFALALTPEPSSVVLLGMGAIGFGAIALRRRRALAD